MWDKKKLGFAMVILVIVSCTSGLIYFKQNTKTREATAKQTLIASIDRQHTLEDQAKLLKTDAPKVDITPARTNKVPSSDQDTITTPNTPNINNATELVPNPQENTNEGNSALTTLSDSDILRIQSHKQLDGGGSHVSFQNMYINERANCDGIIKLFSPLALPDYDKAKVEWITNAKLVYRSFSSQICVRGVLSLTYYGTDNKYGLKPNVKYQGEVEYRLRNSVTDGKSTLKLESINYLTGFKAVKSF